MSHQDIINDVLNLLNNGTDEEQQRALTEAREQRKASSVQQNGDAGKGGKSLSEEDYTLSKIQADNGECFYQDVNGNIDLAEIPNEVFESIGKKKAPFRLTKSMLKHVYDRHGKEMGLENADDAIDFVLDVMDNFDHVRKGNKGALIFSIEKGRNRTGRRAVTILLDSKSGDFYGIKTSGYERIDGLNKKPLLWEKGADKTSATDVASANVTTSKAQQGDEQSGSASNQSNVSTAKVDKVSEEADKKQENVSDSHDTTIQDQVDAAAKEVNTEPTEAQKEAGNYKKGHIKLDGYDQTILCLMKSVRLSASYMTD